MLDWLVPDIPKSVENEIRREKLLASRLSAEAKKIKTGGGGGGGGGEPVQQVTA